MTSDRSFRICVAALAILGGACSGGSAPASTGPRGGGSTGSGGTLSTGGEPGTGGSLSSGGSSATASGGQPGSGGRVESGGAPGSGGTVSSGGQPGTGGATSSGGVKGSGGVPSTGGASQAGGQPGTGGSAAAGGSVGRDAGSDVAVGSGGARVDASPGTGGVGSGGRTGTGGTTSVIDGAAIGDSGGTVDIDCNAAMPTGGQQHSGNSQGGTGNLAWQIWSNAGSGTLTTFASTPAFSAAWNNSGDYLGRLGYEWGNGGKTYDQYGTITAQFTFKKTGSGGSFSYIGIYGWTTNPCIEWYIVDDSFGTMPFTPWNAGVKGSTTMIDGENYKFYSNSTNGTGGSRCNASSWTQFWSIRQKARQCGQISITQHFDAWKAAGMTMGNLLEAKILVETGGGSGSVDFPIANVQTTK